MRGTLFILFVLISISLFGQTLSIDLWHQGKVVLQNGDSIKGLIKYDLGDYLQIMRNNILEMLPSEKINSFEINDQSFNRKRVFYSLPIDKYKKPAFLELLSQGKITVFVKEHIKSTTYSQSSDLAPPKIHRSVVNNYLLLKDDKNFESIKSKQKKWFELMGKESVFVKVFAEKNNLSFADKYQLQKILDYYNSLF